MLPQVQLSEVRIAFAVDWGPECNNKPTVCHSYTLNYK